MEKREIEKAIKEILNAPITYRSIEKLRHLYTVYNNLYSDNDTKYQYSRAAEKPEVQRETRQPKTEFERILQSTDYRRIISVFSELGDTLKVISPRLYEGVVRELKK